MVIRIDDVVCAEPALCWLLDLLASRGMRASLEVIPYLAEFDEGFLDGWDPSRALFEVSQHGFAHVPRTGEDGRRCEFSLEASAPSSEEFDLIARGKRDMEAKFPKRFAAGFSPLSLILPAGILARRLGWSWPCAVCMPFMFPVFLYALLNSTFVTLRQGGIRWRETFYPLHTLRAGNVR